MRFLSHNHNHIFSTTEQEFGTEEGFGLAIPRESIAKQVTSWKPQGKK